MARQVTPAYDRNNAQLYVGDCAEVMAALPAESVDAIVTSPPYAMQRKSTYGGISEADYPAWTVRWMNEARRILKPDGSVIINIRPHVKNGQISDYTLRTRLALRDAEWREVDELLWIKGDAMPTGSPRKPRRSWESLHWFAKHGQPWSDAKANGNPSNRVGAPRGSSAESLGWAHTPIGGGAEHSAGIARSRDWVKVSVRKNTGREFKHPASFPPDLAEWCGRLITPPGGTILDPFNGSASTGVAALRNGWNYIGIDAVEEYVEMSARRLEHAASELESALDLGGTA